MWVSPLDEFLSRQSVSVQLGYWVPNITQNLVCYEFYSCKRPLCLDESAKTVRILGDCFFKVKVNFTDRAELKSVCWGIQTGCCNLMAGYCAVLLSGSTRCRKGTF